MVNKGLVCLENAWLGRARARKGARGAGARGAGASSPEVVG